jgi:hypothetical protein
MLYAVEMGSGAVMYTPNFMKTSSVIQKFMAWEYSIETT